MLPGLHVIFEERKLILRSTIVLALALALPSIQWHSARNDSIHPVLGTLQPDGDVRLRPSQSLQWERAGDGVFIRVWDTVATGSSGRATVVLEELDLEQNVRVRLPPDSVVRFRSADSTVDLSFLHGKGDAAGAKSRRLGSDKPFEFLARRAPRRAPIPPPLDLSALRGLPPLAEPPPALPFQALSDRTWRILQRPLPELPLVAATGKPRAFDPEDYVLRLLSPSVTPDKGHAPPVKVKAGRPVKFRWTPIPFADIAYDLRIESLTTAGYVREYRADKPRFEVPLVAAGRYRCSVVARNKGEPMNTVYVILEVIGGSDETEMKTGIISGEDDNEEDRPEPEE